MEKESEGENDELAFGDMSSRHYRPGLQTAHTKLTLLLRILPQFKCVESCASSTHEGKGPETRGVAVQGEGNEEGAFVTLIRFISSSHLFSLSCTFFRPVRSKR